MLLTQISNRLYDSFLNIVYPLPCALCGMSVESRAHAPACDNCWQGSRVFSHDEALCWKCGALARQSLREVERELIQCSKCDELEFTAARSCGLYEGALRASVLLLKRQPRVSANVASLLVSTAQRSPLNSAGMIIPVPLHPERERRRGFNQAAEIARTVSPRLGLLVVEDCLTRSVASEKYRAGLDAKGRLDTVARAFEVHLPGRIEGEEILLVDDVFTTGATASSCASVLRAAGAKSVFVLTIARSK
jgi:ComF family protein